MPERKQQPSELIPTPDTIREIVAATLDLTKAIRRNCLIKGDEGLPCLPTFGAPIDVGLKIWRLEEALNPRFIPIGERGHRAILVGGWPDLTGLHHSLTWLRDLQDELLRVWALEPYAAGKGIHTAVVDGPDVPNMPASTEDDETIIWRRDERGEWPPKVGEKFVEAMLVAASQIAGSLQWYNNQQRRTNLPSDGPTEPEPVDEKAMLSYRQLAEAFNRNPEAVRKRLDRWREENAVSGDFVENTERRPRDPKYIYRVKTVRHIVEQAPPA